MNNSFSRIVLLLLSIALVVVAFTCDRALVVFWQGVVTEPMLNQSVMVTKLIILIGAVVAMVFATRSPRSA